MGIKKEIKMCGKSLKLFNDILVISGKKNNLGLYSAKTLKLFSPLRGPAELYPTCSNINLLVGRACSN
jgi:hypothetical protein